MPCATISLIRRVEHFELELEALERHPHFSKLEPGEDLTVDHDLRDPHPELLPGGLIPFDPPDHGALERELARFVVRLEVAAGETAPDLLDEEVRCCNDQGYPEGNVDKLRQAPSKVIVENGVTGVTGKVIDG